MEEIGVKVQYWTSPHARFISYFLWFVFSGKIDMSIWKGYQRIHTDIAQFNYGLSFRKSDVAGSVPFKVGSLVKIIFLLRISRKITNVLYFCFVTGKALAERKAHGKRNTSPFPTQISYPNTKCQSNRNLEG